MSPKKLTQTMHELERAALKAQTDRYVLCLYIAGNTLQSNMALANLRELCEAQIIAAPTLVKQRPLPLRRIVGNMTKTDRTLSSLGLQPA